MSVNYAKLFRTVKEFPARVATEIQGEIPKWVKGTLLKNGPGIFEVGQDKYNHWFDGLALLQSFSIENGKVHYSSKYLRSDAYNKNMASQRIVVGEFGTMAYPDPCKSIFHRYFSYYFSNDMTDNDLVNFIQCGDEVYASTETALLNRIDPKTLDTIGQVDLRKYVATNLATAHPHYDRQGNTYNMGSAFSSKDYPSFTIIMTPNPLNEPTKGSNAMEKSRIVANIPTKSAYLSYFHSFGMSKNYVVLPEMPLVMNPLKFFTAAFTRTPFSQCMEWHLKKTVFHVVSIGDSQLSKIKYTADGFFSFHHANAFEIDDCLVVDLVTYEDGKIIQKASMENIRNGNLPETNSDSGLFWRFVLPIKIPSDAKTGDNLLANKNFKTTATAVLQDDGSVHCTHQQLCNKSVEFPRINYEKCNGLPYQFCYFGGKSQSNVYLLDELYKIDVNSGEINVWSRDHSGQFVGEPVFIPRPGATDEDDGVILSSITDVVNEERNYLLVLDGKSFKEIARAHVNHMLPLGIHGHFVEEK